MHAGNPTRRSSGRPTREQAEARSEELLDTALDIFLERGFELTTIEMIASRMNMTKRTVYVKFSDKSVLFLAAVGRAIERQVVPPATLAGFDNGNLRQTLEAVARLRISQVMTRNGLRLQHIIQAESYRFPEIFSANVDQSARPVINFVQGVLDRAVGAGTIAPTDTALAASTFMSMVVGGQVRTIVAGYETTPEEIEAKVRFAVGLLLDGLRPR
ncbi:MAG: TetR/AcrR family transcriptional regulator [Novosphingobium sp.]